MGDTMKGSFFALAEAKYAGGDSIKHTVFDNVERATLKVPVARARRATPHARRACGGRGSMSGSCGRRMALPACRACAVAASCPSPCQRRRAPRPMPPFPLLQVYSSLDNVAGVKIPKFESVSQPGDTKMDLTGA
jgi:hypothetical protein